MIDNASSDNTSELINSFPSIKFIETGSNNGYAAGNNYGLQYATGEIIVIANPDTVADKEWVSRLVEPFENDEQLGATTSKVLLYGKDCINTCGNLSHFTGLDFCRGLDEPSFKFLTLEEIGTISGCSFAIRDSVFKEIGGFDPEFFLYQEDTDLSWRLRIAGYKIMFVPSSIIYHKYSLNITHLKLFYLERNRHMLILKNYQIKTIILSLPSILITELITCCFAISRGMPYIMSKLKAYHWIIKNRDGIMNKRSEIDKNRKMGDGELIRLLEWRIPFEQVIKNRFMIDLADIFVNTIYHANYMMMKSVLR